MGKYKIIEGKELLTTLDKNLIEIQKTIIYYGEKILEELKKLKIDKTKESSDKNILEDPITKHLKQKIIPQN